MNIRLRFFNKKVVKDSAIKKEVKLKLGQI